ncbi:MAG: thiolase family protein [Deltaproteobacteria bacterium]|nr:thiolase family protein [Deltaproteobacteria bacterium]
MQLPRPVYVVDAVRTPIGRYKGSLAEVRPDDLAAHVLRAVLDRGGESLREQLGEVVFGATNQAGEDNRNVGRMAVLLAGLPYEVPGLTVNRLCGSGLEAVNRAAMAISLGDAEVVVAGGVESMTRAPFSMPKASEAFDRNPPPIYDTTIGWRYINPKMAARFSLDSMGETAENVAVKHGVARDAQDAFALESQRRAVAASAAGAFAREIVPVMVKKGKVEEPFAVDESPRGDTTIERLAKLQPVFRKGGSVTAGNSSPINDGAAAVLLASEDAVKRAGVTPLARVVSYAVAAVEPNTMGEGPIPATKKVLARAGWSVSDLDLVELNEAFAAQALACMRALELDPAKVNVNGGSIALGHPIGCSGARIVATLTHAMKARGARRGLASLCIGVGQGISTLFEAV